MDVFLRWFAGVTAFFVLCWLLRLLYIRMVHRKTTPPFTPVPFSSSTPLAYHKLKHEKQAQKYAKPQPPSEPSPESQETQQDWESLAVLEEKLLHGLQEKGISISLMLASLAAEKELLPFYSLCGVMFIDAIPRRLYQLNQEYQAVLLSDIVNIPDSPAYTHVLAIYHKEGKPVLTITSEKNSTTEQVLFSNDAAHLKPTHLSWGQLLWNEEGSSHLLRMFLGDQQSEHGASNRWANLDAFVHRALHMASKTLSINIPPLLLDDGTSSRYIDTNKWEEESWMDLIYCLEVYGMFIMVRLAFVQEVSAEDIEHTFLHRYRVDVCLKTLIQKAPLPLQLGIKVLLDLHMFAQQIQEELEDREVSYLELIQPLVTNSNSFLSYLPTQDVAYRMERFPQNTQLLDCIHALISNVENNLELRRKPTEESFSPHFDV